MTQDQIRRVDAEIARLKKKSTHNIMVLNDIFYFIQECKLHNRRRKKSPTRVDMASYSESDMVEGAAKLGEIIRGKS